MKHILLATLLGSTLVSAHANTYSDHARVIRAEPVTEQTQMPREVCRSIDRPGPAPHRLSALPPGGPAVVIRIGRDDRWGDHGRGAPTWQSPHERRRCHTIYEVRNTVTGYRVQYEYRGQHFSTLLRQHPGAYLRVQVSVQPLAH